MADSNHSAPDFAVYTVKDRKHGQDPFWLRIGAAWINKDEHGYNVQLDALPIDGQRWSRNLRRWRRRSPFKPNASKPSGLNA